MNVTSVSLTWKPFLTIADCDEEGQNCEHNFGLLPDIAKFLSRLSNFSVISNREPNGDWGISPKNGSHDFSGTWDGVMGQVRRKEENVINF